MRHTRRTYKGGAPLAKGSQGSVETIEGDLNGETIILAVIKTTSRDVALDEKRVADKLKEIDPEQLYTIYGTQFIIPEEEELGENGKPALAQLYMLYGGKTVLKTLEDIFWMINTLIRIKKDKSKRKNNTKNTNADLTKEYEKLKAFPLDELKRIEEAFKPLKKFVPKLYKAGIIHKDIHSGNIVWDGTRLRLIDWGESVLEGDTNSKGVDRFKKLGETYDIESLEGEEHALHKIIKAVEEGVVP